MAKYKLDELCEFITDGTHQTPEYCEEGGVIFLSSKDVTERKINWDDVKYIPESLHQKLYKRLSPKLNDILLAKNGTTGVAAIVDRDEVFDVYVSLAVLRPLESVYPKYLLYAINSPVAKRQFNAGLKGIGVPNLHLGVIRETVVNVAPRDEQEKICEILDKVASVIDSRKAELSALDDLIKARFVELFGNPIVNERGWDVAELNSVCDGIGDGLHGTPEYDMDGGYPFINGNNLMNGVIEITPATKMVDEATYKKHYIELSDNAILLSINGTLGKLAFYNGEEVMLGKSACYCNLKSNINREFVYGVMKTDAFMGFLESNATASTIKNVGLKAIRGFKLILPPDDLQIQFVEFSKQVDKSKVAVQKSLDETQQLFDSLMQRYFG